MRSKDDGVRPVTAAEGFVALDGATGMRGTMGVRWLDTPELLDVFTPALALRAVEAALEDMAWGRAEGVRHIADTPEGASLLMTAQIPDALAVKIVQARGANLERGLPRHPGVVILFDPTTGLPRAGFDAEVITGRRTGAIAAFAAERLAPNRQVAAVVGAGSQGFYQAEALLSLGGLEELRLFNRTAWRARELMVRLRGIFPDVLLSTPPTLKAALSDADVVTVATASPEPIVSLADVKPGALVNAVGAYRPNERELATDLVQAATLFADTLQGCLEEAGDFLIPASEGVLDLSRVHPLSDVLGRERFQGTLVMKSVGSAVFDAAAAQAVWRGTEAPPADDPGGSGPR